MLTPVDAMTTTGSTVWPRRRSARLGIATALLVASSTCDEDRGQAPRVDEDSSNANVVVKVGSCSGILLTPRIALTASHCIRGSKNPAGPGAAQCAVDSIPYVSVGPESFAPDAVFHTGIAKTKLPRCEPASTFGEDLAVVYLATAVSPGAPGRKGWKVPRVVRPTLMPPATDDGQFVAIPTFAGYSPWNDGYTKVAFLSRRLQSLLGLSVERGIVEDGGYFKFDVPDRYGIHAGDSGGPLFTVRPDGSRDPVGVVSMTHGDSAYAADITTPSNRQWLLDHLTEGAVMAMAARQEMPVSYAHSAAWLARHGKTADDWWGELDYSGPCRRDEDRDCDGFLDAAGDPAKNHDDCALEADAEQEDVDDDGIGDACAGASEASHPRAPAAEPTSTRVSAASQSDP